ncbi:pim1 protein + RNA transporter 2 [Kwoniella mangroviensis CBS 10435]|uniref:Pim1 protein + RNA transporter 2 n=1 Tax=Kwoniella mangroviensis CBS 10435 TaxID=1331196 RepID=A0A1B9IQ37_9TREE|nr:pim1 protein + RNA transporter 2 [Kwoniella mangroviensis CBS 10435]
MPPRKSSTPASSAKPASKPSKAASTTTKPVSSAKPVSRRGAAAKESTPAVVPPAIAEDCEASDLPNGKDVKRTRKATSPPATDGPAAKKGRVGQLVDEVKRGRRRSSIGPGFKNELPSIPPIASPHNALFIWGTGDMGQFGLGPDELDEIARPKIHSWFEEEIEDGKLSRDGKEGSGGLEAVACGGMHTLAIDEAGRVRSWGINDNAALGRVTTNVPDPKDPESIIPNEDLETVPLVVEALEKEGFRAVKVAAGDSVSVAISDQGELRAWGSFRSNEGVLGFDGVPGHPTFQFTPIALPVFSKLKIADVSCGTDHVLALTTAGHVYVWGNGQQNQLGRRVIERRIKNSLEPERLGLRNIVLVAAGSFHSFAVDVDGIVWAWGLNTFHQTGLEGRYADEEMVIAPRQVEGLNPENHGGSKVVQISGGEHHSLFLFDNGEVWGVGRSDANELGIPEDHPAYKGIIERREKTQEERQDRVKEKQDKLDHILQQSKVDENQKEKLELELSEAQAALRVPMGEYIPEPVRICFPPIPEQYEVVPPFPAYKDSKSSDNPIINISAGTRHNLAVSKSGHVYAWGLGNQAQLGLGADTESAEVPSLVRSKLLRPYKAKFASAGGQHCVLLATENE